VGHGNLLRNGSPWSELRLKLTTIAGGGLSGLPSELQIIAKFLAEIPGLDFTKGCHRYHGQDEESLAVLEIMDPRVDLMGHCTLRGARGRNSGSFSFEIDERMQSYSSGFTLTTLESQLKLFGLSIQIYTRR
jgi:hypothetical protein